MFRKEIQVTDYLTWEYCADPGIQYLNCSSPEPVRNHMPQWFKKQKAHNLEINVSDQQTIRNCLGFRGLASIGYTIPLPEQLNGHNTYFSQGNLHPEMLYGTHWANKTDNGSPWTVNDSSPYEYCVRLLRWPWRAKMPIGWRLLILPYLLDWNNDWHEFAGAVEPNYLTNNDGCGIGHGLIWDIPADISHYNYYNLETVIAFKRSTIVEMGTLTFSAIPLYDPELLKKQSYTVCS